MIESRVVRDPVLDANWGLDITLRPSEEAKICLNCDLPKCKNSATCKRYKEAKRKLKEKSK